MEQLLASLFVYKQIHERVVIDVKNNMVKYSLFDENKAITNINDALTILNKYLKTLTPNQVDKYKFGNDRNLRYCYTNVKKIRNKVTGPLVQSVFVNILQLENLRTQATEIFNSFLRGITLFNEISKKTAKANVVKATVANTYNVANSSKSSKKIKTSKADTIEEIGPEYHRLKSCGPRSVIRKCSIQDDAKNLAINKRLAYTCHVERLIYDQIYTRYNIIFPNKIFQIESAQNEGHLTKIYLETTDFETCFPNLEVLVEIEFGLIDNLEYPKTCIITKRTKIYQNIISIETYKKELNIDTISYEDLYFDNVFGQLKTSRSKMYKIQSFMSPKIKWIKNDAFLESVFN